MALIELVYESVPTKDSGGFGVQGRSLVIAGRRREKDKILMISLSRKFSCKTCLEWSWEVWLLGQVSLASSSQNTLSPSNTRPCVFLSGIKNTHLPDNSRTSQWFFSSPSGLERIGVLALPWLLQSPRFRKQPTGKFSSRFISREAGAP